jgi:DNA-3-methyladenine glycosylase
LHRPFFARDARSLAIDLIGRRLHSSTQGVNTAGVIVETEAYLGVIDRAAHTFGGRRTPRNASMWGPPGHAYVYFTYGLHHCVNIVAGSPGEPVAVLIRALEPVEGLDVMRRRRSVRLRRAGSLADTLLCSGPARLCEALGIDRSLDGVDLCGQGPLWIEAGGVDRPCAGSLRRGPRVGVGYAGAWAQEPLRFAASGNPHVSRPPPLQPLA